MVHRTGQGASPWAKLDADKARTSSDAPSGNSADTAASLMRTGMMRTGTAGQRKRHAVAEDRRLS